MTVTNNLTEFWHTIEAEEFVIRQIVCGIIQFVIRNHEFFSNYLPLDILIRPFTKSRVDIR